jgi:RND family efflux transporter MFP subunit
MSLIQAIKQRAALLVMLALLGGVVAHEWREIRSESLIASAQAKPKASKPSAVLAEGRLATYPGGQVTVGAELAGKLVTLRVKERDRVKAGDLLAEIDVDEQRAALNEAWARVKEAEGDVSYLGREQSRAGELFAQRVLPQAELDRHRHDAKNAELRRASLLAASSRLRVNLDKAKIMAPIDGIVTLRFANAGEMLTAGAPIVTLSDLSKLRVEVEVGEFDAGRVKVDAPAQIRAEGYEGKVWKGTVEEIPDEVVPRRQRPLDPSRPVDTRVLLVKVRLDEPTPLRLGQRVEVEVVPATVQ